MIIYKATNLINQKLYIGQTTLTLEQRQKRHFSEALNPNKRNAYFHNAICKYGKENFIFEIIDTAISIDELNDKEQYWISYYNSTNKNIGYNLDSGGKNCFKSKSTKEKIGSIKKENWKNPELSKKMKLGIIKATQKWIQICKDKEISMICQNCGKEFLLPLHMTKNRKYCSLKCANEINIKKATKSASIKNHLVTQEKYINIKSIASQWAIENKEIINKCPKNNIKTNLAELQTTILNNFNTKDWRIISKAICSSESVKDLLNWLQSFVNMYAELV